MKLIYIFLLAQLIMTQVFSMNLPTATPRNTNGDRYIIPRLKKIGLESSKHFKMYLLNRFSFDGAWPITNHNIPDDMCYVDKNLSLICQINTYKLTRIHDQLPIDYIFYPKRGHFRDGNLWNVGAPQNRVFLSLNLVEFEEYTDPTTKAKNCTYRFSARPYYPSYKRGFDFVSFKVVSLPLQHEDNTLPDKFVPWFQDIIADSVEYRVGCSP